MKTIEEQIGETLAKETGMPSVGVSITNDKIKSNCVKMSVGEFLSKDENKYGTWFIDGGWGGPPGPIHVRWDEETTEWENGGFCGRKFRS